MPDKRDADVAARLGGEEFALLLPETTDLAAMQFAERLRQKVRDHAPMQALYDAKRAGRDRVTLWRSYAAAVLREATE